ncbi:MAG: response regulator [Cyclobacteriaceae bacterium]
MDRSWEHKVLRSVIDNIPDTVYIKDKKGVFQLINKAQAEILGLEKPEQAYGKSDFDFFKHAQLAYNEEQEIIRSERPVINHVIEIETVAGEVLHLSETKFPIYNDEGECIGLAGVSRNITDLIKLQRSLIKEKDIAQRSDQLKSRFLANLSHELRTPLNIIVGLSGLVFNESIDIEKRKEFRKHIEESSNLLTHLINDILDLSKIESGMLKLNFSIFDLNALVSRVVKDQKLNFESEVQIQCDTLGENLYIETDKGRLEQVLINLISNAKKFTTKGQITISYKDLDDQQLEFVVEDTGAGIPADKINLIFESFVQADAFSPGSGLGLAISRNIIKLLGGEIGVESKVGLGTRFVFTINFKEHKGLDKPIQNERKKIFSSQGEGGKMRALIAEDNHSNYELLSLILDRSFEVTWAKNGLEAIEEVKKNAPNIIFMDLKMPEVDGLEATRTIRSFNEEVIIIAVTGNAYDSDREMAYAVGCNEFISKPINIYELREVIEKHMGNVDISDF